MLSYQLTKPQSKSNNGDNAENNGKTMIKLGKWQPPKRDPDTELVTEKHKSVKNYVEIINKIVKENLEAQNQENKTPKDKVAKKQHVKAITIDLTKNSVKNPSKDVADVKDLENDEKKTTECDDQLKKDLQLSTEKLANAEKKTDQNEKTAADKSNENNQKTIENPKQNGKEATTENFKLSNQKKTEKQKQNGEEITTNNFKLPNQKTDESENPEEIARGLLQNYKVVRGTFPAIAKTHEVTSSKIATMTSPLLHTQNLVGKTHFDSPSLGTLKSKDDASTCEVKTPKRKKISRSQTVRGTPTRVVKTDESKPISPLTLAKLATLGESSESEVKTKYSRDAIIDVKNYGHYEDTTEYTDEMSVFRRMAKAVARSRKYEFDFTQENQKSTESVLADSNHVICENDQVKFTQSKSPKQGSIQLTSYTLCMEDRLLRKDDPSLHFNNYLGNRNVIDVRWFNNLQSKPGRKGHRRARSFSH